MGCLDPKLLKLASSVYDDLKGDVSFEHWEYEVETLSRVFTESEIKEAITKCLKGSAAEALRSLGPLASVAEIMISMKGKYSVPASYDSLMRDYYTLVQEENEKDP